MAEDVVGKGTIEIGADDSQLDKDMKSIHKDVVKSLADAAEDGMRKMRHSFEVGAKRIRDKLDDLGKDIKPKIDLTLDGYRKAKTYIQLLGKDQTVRMIVRTVGLGKAAAEIKALATGLSGLGMIRNLTRGFSTFLQNLPQMTLQFGLMASAAASIVAPLGAAASAIAPLATSLAAILPLALAAPAAFGAMALSLWALTAIFKDLDKATGEAAKKFNEELGVMKAGMASLKGTLQQSFFAEFNGSLMKLAKITFPQMQKGLARLGTSLGRIGKSITGNLGQALKDNTLTAFFHNLARGMDLAKSGIGDIVYSLTTIATKGGNLFPNMGKEVSRIGAQFREWTKNADIEGMISAAYKQTLHLFGVVKQLAGIIGGIFRAMDTGKSSGLESLEQTLTKIHGIIDSPPFQFAVNSLFQGMSEGATKLQEALGPVGKLFESLLPVIGRVISILAGGAASALTGISEALSDPKVGKAFEGAVQGIADALAEIDWEALADVLIGLFDAVKAAAPTAVGILNTLAPVASKLLPIITKLIEAFGDLPGSVQLGIIAIGLLTPKLFGLIKLMDPKNFKGLATLFRGTKAGPFLASLAGAEGKIGVFSKIGKGLITLIRVGIPAAFSAMGTAIMAIPVWGWIIAAVVALVGVLIWFFTQTEVGKKAWSDFSTWIIGVWGDIVSAATSIWQGLVDFFVGLWEGIIAAPQMLVDWFNNTFIPFFQSLPGIIGGFLLQMLENFLALPGEILGALLTLLSLGIDLFTQIMLGMITAVELGIQGIIYLFTVFPGQVIGFLQALPGMLTTFFTNLWSTITTAVQNGISAVVSFFSTLPSRVIGGLASLGGLLASWFSGAWSRLKRVVTSGISALIGFFKAIPGKIMGALSSLASILGGVFQRAWDRSDSSVKAGITRVVNSVKGLIGKVKGALGNLGSTLYNAGKSIIDGFLRGLKASWQAVTDFVGGIASWIAKNKGPLSYDFRLLQPAGKMIMGGFNKTLREGMESAKKLVGDFNSTLGGDINVNAWSARRTAPQTISNDTYYQFGDVSMTAASASERSIIEAYMALAKRKARAAGASGRAVMT